MAAVESLGPRSATSPWRLTFDHEPRLASVNAARLAITDGVMGTRALSETCDETQAATAVRIAGIHGPEPPGALATGPSWTPHGWPGTGTSWTLDLATGTVAHRIDTGGSLIETRRWSVAGRPGCQVHAAPLSAAPDGGDYDPPAPTVLVGDDGTVAATVAVHRPSDGFDLRVAGVATGPDRSSATGEAAALAAQVASRGHEALVADQRRHWHDRWSACSVTIDGDPEADVGTRYALFHLLALADHGPELAVGARGLTGDAYAGHVFWDADVFVLPSLATVAPSAARAMIRYRVARLDAARKLAAAGGHAGARFPWESAHTGVEVTPPTGLTATGETVPILTGQQELHIGADIVWAVQAYCAWTGDDGVLAAGGSELCIEVARFWRSVITLDEDGLGHIDEVIGPDEYHEGVDDNAFTNLMAAHALSVAADPAVTGPSDDVLDDERDEWRRAADTLVRGYDRTVGRHEQFAGYRDLDPIMAASIAPVPFAADLLLPWEVIQRSQLIKQADVVMAHHLIPDDLPTGSLERDLRYYLPRTAHGSSLSPAVHASVLARAGRPDEALTLYRIALAIDLDDLTRTGAGGIHYANLGGVWQAMLRGFLGIRPGPDGLVIDPRLPSGWSRVAVGFRYRGRRISVEATQTQVEVTAEDPVRFAGVGGRPPKTAHRLQLVAGDDGWRLR